MFSPINLGVESRRCTIVGAGAVAQRKCRTLLDHSALVRAIAPEIKSGRFELNERAELIEQPYDCKFLSGSFLLIAATNAVAPAQRMQWRRWKSIAL